MKKTKEDLVKLIARDTGYTKDDIRNALNSFVRVTKKLIAEGNELNIPTFGKFYTDEVNQKQWDLNNREFRDMSYKVIRVKFSDDFKAEVNNR